MKNYEIELLEIARKLEENVPNISSERRYWLIRAGKESVFFNEFLRGGFTGIAWDLFDDIENLKTISKEDLELKAIELYPEEINIGNIVGKILTFINEVKKDDVVLMPSAGKEIVSFGIIESDEVYFDNSLVVEESLKGLKKQTFGIPNKRRKVKWIKNIEKKYVNSKLLLNLSPPHSISEITDDTIINIIDSTLDFLYVKNDVINLLFKIGKDDDNSLKDIGRYISLLEDMSEFLSCKFGFDNDISIKLNLNSKGDSKIIGKTKNIFLLALIVSSLTGGEVTLLGQTFKFNGVLELYKEYNLEKQREFERKLASEGALEKEIKESLKNIEVHQ